MKAKKILKQEILTLHTKYIIGYISKNKRYTSVVPQSVLLLRAEMAKKLAEQQKLVEEAEEVVKAQKSKKKKILNAVFFGLNIVVVVLVLYFQLKGEGIGSLDLVGVNGWFIVFAFFIFAFLMFMKSMRMNFLVKKTTKRSRPFLSYKTAALGRYYDDIVPFNAGGQPFQVYYLNKRGLPISSALSVPLGEYFLGQIAWLVINIFAVIYCLAMNTLGNAQIVLIFSLISFFINSLFFVGTIILAMSKRAGKIFIEKVYKLLFKMKLVKNYEKSCNRALKTISDFQESLKSFSKDIKSYIFLTLFSIVYNLLQYSIPFFLYAALVRFDPSLFFDIMVNCIMIDIASTIMPLPGGTGMSEFSFTEVFKKIFEGGTVFWALLLWRFFNYYIAIFQGILIIIYDYFIGNKKYNWQKKKYELENESIVFRNRQLKEYKRKKRVSLRHYY